MSYPRSHFITTSTTVSSEFEDNQKSSHPLKMNEAAILSTPTHFGVLEAPQFKNDFQALCELAPKKIVVDMSATLLMTSVGLGALVSCLKTCKAKGIELVLWSVNPDVMSVLAMTKLTDVFKIENATSAVRTQTNKKLKPSVESNSLPKQVQRAIDIGVAAVGLGITAALLIPISIAIKLDSPGPIFSEEARYGLMGKFFRMRTFRSTVEKSVSTDVATPEMTKFGHFLRKTNLDKLPLLWNVLVGDMSLVGPRASTMEEVDSASTTEWRALEVKPGLLSEWTVAERVPSRKEKVQPAPSASVTSISNTQNRAA